MKTRTTLLLSVLSCFSALGANAQETLFQLLPSKGTGIEFRNEIDETEKLNVLSYEYFYNGGGVAVGDINNDGLDDLFFTANMGPNKLYLNLGNLRFRDITKDASPGLAGRKDGWKTGVTMADVNGDGLLDIYICYSGNGTDEQRKNELFVNQGNLKFVESAKSYGLDIVSYSTQAAFFDYDNDGDLDMFQLNHSTKKIDNLELAKFRNETDELAGNKLMENRDGHFVDVSQKAGIRQYPLTFGLGLAITDINKDGWQDIYVTNDYNEPDCMYVNNRDGTFTEDAKNCFRHMSQFSMGVDIADFNNDGLPDVYTLDMLPEDNRRQKLLQLQENYESFELMVSQDLHNQYMRNMLQLNNGDGTFSEIAQAAGVSNTDWSWTPLFADFDNDGYKDLFVTNGYMRDYTNKDFLKYRGDYKVKKAIDREPVQLMDLVKAMPVTLLSGYIYRNNGDLTFTNVKKEWGINKQGLSNGAVYADLDNDGDLDLVVNNLNDRASVFKNTSRERSQSPWMAIRLKYKDKNLHGVGAKVYVYTKSGEQYQEVNPNRGYLSCVSTTVHFGLGRNKAADSVKIVWPDNTIHVMNDAGVNQVLTVEYKGGQPKESVPAAKPAMFKLASGVLDYRHEDFMENDFKRQLLMLFMYSKAGPVIAKGDVNRDGLEDMFISGDKSKTCMLYLQQANGKFAPVKGPYLGDENIAITSAALFFDANGDGFADLYVGKGGYTVIEPESAPLQDELFLNDGKGNLVLTKEHLPVVTGGSKSCIVAGDYDNDGDLDLFVGSRVIPGNYPLSPRSYLLQNDGKGKFTAVTSPMDNVGMVTDAKFADLNKDGKIDLLLCGEFMPVMVFENTGNGFADKTTGYFDTVDKGLWFGLSLADLDGDGNDDIIAGNLGQNSQLQFSAKEPAELYYGDFDNNGSIDPFFNFYIQGVSYPFVSRDELNEQMYAMRRRFTTYKDYADATINKILLPEEMANAKKLAATENRSVCYLRKGGKFVKQVLPLPAQFSVVSRIIPADYDKDGKTDLLLLGNHLDNRLKIGSIDANYGCLLKGDGQGGFTYVRQDVSGLKIVGDVKSALTVDAAGKKYLVVGISNQPLQVYEEP
ncbi:VCBS repeat-containing protein [Flavihumibacter solisilvae]|uniref:VCBS repeat-containing protein n=1 Tax=Flavihumibacter solisilvae TaxID=1349421 RepID=UPI0009E38BEB|nr:VCBS repeat-containing protein [Flavihumibacter solisilvae]